MWRWRSPTHPFLGGRAQLAHTTEAAARTCCAELKRLGYNHILHVLTKTPTIAVPGPGQGKGDGSGGGSGRRCQRVYCVGPGRRRVGAECPGCVAADGGGCTQGAEVGSRGVGVLGVTFMINLRNEGVVGCGRGAAVVLGAKRQRETIHFNGTGKKSKAVPAALGRGCC